MDEVKKTITREMALNWLGEVFANDKKFWSRDGGIFRSLEELRDGLKNMELDIYQYHLNENKNDFARWVSDVIGDHELSVELGQAKNGVEAAQIITNRIEVLKRKISTT
ncbi:hypothetical protein ACFLXC_04580 [Chloroflexota bacterium]